MTVLKNDLNPDFTMGGFPIHTDLNHNENGNPHKQYVTLTIPNRSNPSTTANRYFKVLTITLSKSDIWSLVVLKYFRSDLNSAVFEPFGELILKVGVISSGSTQYAILKADKPNAYCEFYSKIVSQTSTSITVDIYIKDLESTSVNTRYQFKAFEIDSYDSKYTTVTFYPNTDWVASLPSGSVVCDYITKEVISPLTIFSANGWQATTNANCYVAKKTDSKMVYGHLEIQPVTSGTAPAFPQVCNLPYTPKYAGSFPVSVECTDGTVIQATIRLSVSPAQMSINGVTGVTKISNAVCNFLYETP